MKRILASLLLLTQLMSVQSGWGSERIIDRENLVRRFGYYLPEKYRAAVKHLQKKYPADYHPDGDRLMYSSIGTNNRWQLFELNLKNGKTVQLTPDTYRDFDSFDGCYTPDGRYIFCSTGTFLGLPCTNGDGNMCGIFSYDPQTKRTRQLTYDQDSNWNPVIMENGTVLYQRWEYVDLPHSHHDSCRIPYCYDRRIKTF